MMVDPRDGRAARSALSSGRPAVSPGQWSQLGEPGWLRNLSEPQPPCGENTPGAEQVLCRFGIGTIPNAPQGACSLELGNRF